MNPKYKSGYFKQGYTIWTPNSTLPTAGKEMDAACQADGSKIGGVYSMNDAMAADVYPAIVRCHLKKILTGQDAQPDGLGRILTGQQGMTVFEDVKYEADAAAELAYNWVLGKGLPSNYKASPAWVRAGKRTARTRCALKCRLVTASRRCRSGQGRFRYLGLGLRDYPRSA